MNKLPKDALLSIAINLELEDLLRFCQSSDIIDKKVCQRNDIWLYKIKKSFPSLTLDIMNKYKGDRKWKDYYIQDLYSIKNPNTTLINSSQNDRLDLVIAALDLGANIHENNDLSVELASQNGHYEVVKLLIDNKADIHSHSDYAIRWASDNGHLEVVKLLIEKGANIHSNVDMAVRRASRNGHYDVVKLLMKHGAPDPRNI